MTRRRTKGILFLLVCVVASTVAGAAADLNEVAPFLVFPSVLTETYVGSGVPVETWLSVTNSAETDYTVRVTFIDGTSCQACDFTVSLVASDAEVIVVRDAGANTELTVLSTNQKHSCSATRGFVTVSLEDGMGNTLTDNVLLGEQKVIDYTNGRSFATEAIALQGINGDGDRIYEFDDVEYSKLPRVIALDLVAPNAGAPTEFDAYLTLFTLAFADGDPPLVDCSVTGYDEEENPFSSSVQFGCWTQVDVGAIDTEFYYPNLGAMPPGDDYGWLQLNCRVDADADPDFEIDGGVHGAIQQYAPTGTVLFERAQGSTLDVGAPISWGNAAQQSVTTGDALTLDLE
ncbi:MAG: hypothetical protein GY716_20160 [bacterium]|nr:hypothetical protein [bacterium]